MLTKDMDIKKSLLLIFTILCVSATWAAPVSQSQALKNAKAFMSARGIAFDAATARVATRAPRRAAANAQAVAYYVFNDDAKFVIAAGDDTMPAVLGYSTDGDFDANNISPELQALLDSYDMVADGKAVFDRPTGEQGRQPIEPLLKARWNQSAPWNNQCPVMPDKGTHSATGCAGTAMAQVMSYHRWPERITATIPAYTTGSYKFQMPALKPSGFPGWANIKDYYLDGDTIGPAADDVAALMLYVGQSIYTDYGPGSGASPSFVPDALINYFGYSKSARYVNRDAYVTPEWHKLLYDELAAARPVCYFGFKFNGGGHAFVCDGYDGADMYHINWGWYGRGNGYFLLTALNPAHEGIGSVAGYDGYDRYTGMVIGIEPDRGQEVKPDVRLTVSNISLSNTVFTRRSSSTGFSRVGITCRFSNETNDTYYDYVIGYALTDESNRVLATLFTQSIGRLETGYNVTKSSSFSIPASIPDGEYTILPVTNVGDDSWYRCYGADANRIVAKIEGNTLTLSLAGNIGTKNYIVNSVGYKGAKQVGRPLEVVANLTNNGNCSLTDICVLVNGTPTSSSSCALLPGETGDVAVHFTPKEVGEYRISLATDHDGKQIIYNGNVAITGGVDASMEVSSLKVMNANAAQQTVGGAIYKGSAVVKNTGTSPYDDVIVTQIWRDNGTDAGAIVASRETPVTMKPGESRQIDFEFDDLQVGEKFRFAIGYYDNCQLTEAAAVPFYTLVEDVPATVTGDVNGDSVVDIKDLNIIVNIVLGQQPREQYPNADINADNLVDILDINQIINLILGI